MSARRIINEVTMYREEFMREALNEARLCASLDEVPVGAVIVKDGKIVSRAGNRKESKNNALCHAELIAIDAASAALGHWWLENCEMYVTLEPCPMCAGAMINARIKSLYFGAYDKKGGGCGSKIDVMKTDLFNHNINVSGGHLEEECGKILTEFFENKRSQKKLEKSKTTTENDV